MRLISDTKLDFRDVLILPKRSTLSSRSEVSLERTFNFKNSKQTWTGVPIMVSNMDTTGTFEMAHHRSRPPRSPRPLCDRSQRRPAFAPQALYSA